MAAGYNSGGHKDQVEGERELSWQWRHRRMAGSLREATKKTVSTFPHIFYSLQFIQIQSSQMRVWLSPVISSMEVEQIFKFEKESYMPEEFNDSSKCMLCSVCVCWVYFFLLHNRNYSRVSSKLLVCQTGATGLLLNCLVSLRSDAVALELFWGARGGVCVWWGERLQAVRQICPLPFYDIAYF